MSKRDAAALLLTRGEGAAVEVYLVERSPELRFFGGYLALPGGTLSPVDGDAVADEGAAMQRCGLRELFEETGLLRHALPAARATTAHLRAVRTAMLQRDTSGTVDTTAPWAQLIDGVPPPPPLTPVCRIATPAFAPVRYDTVFLHVPVESCRDDQQGCEPSVWPGELTAGRFWRPDAALTAWRRGEILLVPPVVILLEHLAAAHGDMATFQSAIRTTTEGYRRGNLHLVRFSPGVVLAPLRTPTLPPATTTNCYIVGRDELWVIDPGSPEPEEQARLLALLDQLCQDGARLGGVIATHHHPDHVGGIAALCAARNLAVRGHPITLERLPTGCRLGAPLAHGDRIDLGCAPDGQAGWHLRAIHTPGHDRGHLCFHESRYGTAIVGDMISTISTIIIDPPEGHLGTYLRSLELLADSPMTTLYPAHGPAMRDGRKLVKQYLRHRGQREAGLLDALAKGAGTIAELLPLVYWDAKPELHRFAARSLLAGLEKLQEEGRVTLAKDRWTAVRS